MTMNDLQARHKKEQKELQGRIVQKKKNASKKTRRGVNDECERLERELKERQEAEVQALLGVDQQQDESETTEQNGPSQNGLNESSSQPPPPVQQLDRLELTGNTDEDVDVPATKSKKPNRQKARLARRAAEQDAQISAAAAEAAEMPNMRDQEMQAMKEQMEKRNLTEILIRPDGHCLYSACASTITSDRPQTHQTVRSEAANFMGSHPDDFAPFLEEPLEGYVTKIRSTAEWGGHLELQAIAKAYNVQVNVLRSTGHVETISPDTDTKDEIWLAYYLHSFGLGEHYNALKKTVPV